MNEGFIRGEQIRSVLSLFQFREFCVNHHNDAINHFFLVSKIMNHLTGLCGEREKVESIFSMLSFSKKH